MPKPTHTPANRTSRVSARPLLPLAARQETPIRVQYRTANSLILLATVLATREAYRAAIAIMPAARSVDADRFDDIEPNAKNQEEE